MLSSVDLDHACTRTRVASLDFDVAQSNFSELPQRLHNLTTHSTTRNSNISPTRNLICKNQDRLVNAVKILALSCTDAHSHEGISGLGHG